MASLLDVNNIRRVDNRSHILVFLSRLCPRQQTVEMSDEIGICLYLLDIFLSGDDEVIEEFGLK